MGEDFPNMTHIYRGSVNVVVSSAGRRPARYMERTAGIPRVEGIPMGPAFTQKCLDAVHEAYRTKKNVFLYPHDEDEDKWNITEDRILVLGEEIFARTLASVINELPSEKRMHLSACALWPDVDEGLPELRLIPVVRSAKMVIADPLYKVILPKGEKEGSNGTRFVPFPHEAYSGRIYRNSIPVFAGPGFDPERLIKGYDK